MGNENPSSKTNPTKKLHSDSNFILEIHTKKGGTSRLGSFDELSKKAKNSICKIEVGGDYGTGFFTKIPDPNDEDKKLRVLFSCNHILNKEKLEQLNEISIVINHQKINLNLDKRKIWANPYFNYDYICIEIFKNDGFKYFLNIDENIIEHNYSIQEYQKEDNLGIYVFGVEEDSEIGFDNGIVTGVENHMLLKYNCNTNPGWSGGVVINNNTNSIIAIHKGGDNEEKCNYGIFIKVIIENIKETNYFKIKPKNSFIIIENILGSF